ncbi:cytochrome c biogenesis heme-transporting ATPase CcmA [Leucothrix pacifica]|uniref:Heme ABC transporter ATP-binding protein CcmA n=1 Tax=Leucothrix pacifica TaxID=1247513 RepID=A0A317CHR0_9GAMM|nr:cytochrome c biogenesis heme-transporting ATPase CcmA [Leucothrix pacifica]PWQ95830.1 heme ABC transporter ATP-binding protein CcmA [Leucothrix pacifica]
MTLSVKQLQCSRGDLCLFQDLSLELQAGQLLRLEGKNGSGKTTLLRTLCGLFMADEGEILWRGESIRKTPEVYYRELFYLGHQNALKLDLNPLENLQVLSRLVGQNVSEEVIEIALAKMGLAGYEDVPVRKLSQGQKRRVALSRLLINEAPLWVLDEPFVALDVAAVELLQSIIVQHVQDGGMVILTTHQAVPLPETKMQRLSLDRYV